MRLVLEDQLAQGGGGWPDQGRVLADAVDGPVGMAAMARRHVVGHGGVLVVAAHALMSGDAFAPGEDLDGVGGEPGQSQACRAAPAGVRKRRLETGQPQADVLTWWRWVRPVPERYFSRVQPGS
jgi:hypothetical protein